jgi:hypothetical protein
LLDGGEEDYLASLAHKIVKWWLVAIWSYTGYNLEGEFHNSMKQVLSQTCSHQNRERINLLFYVAKFEVYCYGNLRK